MVGLLWDLFYISRNQRLASLTAIAVYICVCFVQPIMCFENKNNEEKPPLIINNTLIQLENGTQEISLEEFDILDKTLHLSADPFDEGHKFFQSFVKEINSQYGFYLTVEDACNLIRANLHMLSLDNQSQEALLSVLELYQPINPDLIEKKSKELDISENISTLSYCSGSIGIPFYFYLHKLHRHKHKNKHHLSSLAATVPSAVEIELPSNVYAGGAEILAGALLCVIAPAIPAAGYLGSTLIADGARRVYGGMVQLSDERRANPNFVEPPSPPGFNF